MALTDDRDARDAIWHATDAISNRLINDSMFIEKAKYSMEDFKDFCYDLGEQKVWIKGKHMEYKEEYGMTGSEFKRIENDIRMIHGNMVVEGLENNDCTAHIEVPFEYLKYIKVAMPTTDFCVSKRKDTGNWIEGLPAIKKIETYNDRVAKVTFIDNTFTKSVCSENDHFDLDTGITICCMKRILGENGNKLYNDIIRHAHKVITENDKKKEAEAKNKAEQRMKDRKLKLKKAAKKLKAIEEQIGIQSQAIIRAHEELEARAREA